MDKVKAAWAWLKANPRAALAFVAALFSAWLLWKFRRGRMASLADAITVKNEATAIAEKQGRATQMFIQGDAESEEAKKLEAEIVASKRRVVEIYNGESMEGKTDAEVARAFTAAGF